MAESFFLPERFASLRFGLRHNQSELEMARRSTSLHPASGALEVCNRS